MINLFLSFDLYYFYSSLILLVLLITLFLANFNFITGKSKILFVVTNALISFFSSLKPKIFSKGGFLIFFSLFLSIFILNIFSINSYIFSLASQVSVTISVAFSFWGSIVLFQIIKNPKAFIYHAIPEGSPIYLRWFLFVIELVRVIIRPLTLLVRLSANIIAGHLLLILLSKIALYFTLGTLVYLVLNVTEVFVALIQAYVFSTIVCLYFSELH